MSRFLNIPASFRSPRAIMSSTPLMEVGCIVLILRSGDSHCSWPSSSITWILVPSGLAITRAPRATSNSLLDTGSIQIWSPYTWGNMGNCRYCIDLSVYTSIKTWSPSMTFFDAFRLGLVLDIMKFLDIIVNIEFFLSCASSISSHKCQLVLYMSTSLSVHKEHYWARYQCFTVQRWNMSLSLFLLINCQRGLDKLWRNNTHHAH